MPDAITGSWAAATTPVDTAGAIHHAALGRHAQRLLRWGCDGLVLFGSCGEGPSLSLAEPAAPDIAALIGTEVLIARAMAAGGQGTICGMANLVPALIRRLLDGQDTQADIGIACAPLDSIPLLKATLAAITGEVIWRNVRPPLQAGDAAAGARIAALLDTLEQRPAA